MRVGVVGGGVVGLATGHYLQKLGAHPIIVEAGGVGGGCSRGNNGWVCPSVSTPLPAPGLTWKSLLWMLKRASHFHIQGTALPRLAPWLFRFRGYCTETERTHGIRALASLNSLTGALYDELAADGVDFERGRSGILFAFRDSALHGEKLNEIRAVAANSATLWRDLDEDEVYDMEPLLRPGFTCGIHVETDQHVRPELLTEGLGASLRAGGAEIFEGAMVLGFEWEKAGGRGTVRTSRWAPVDPRAGPRVRGIVTSRGDLEVDAVVLAAGAQTGPLARMAAAAATALPGRRARRDDPLRGRAPLRRDNGAVGREPPDGYGAGPGPPPRGEPRCGHPGGGRGWPCLGGDAPDGAGHASRDRPAAVA